MSNAVKLSQFLLLSALSFSSFADSTTSSSIESCSTLLPDGHSYEVTIKTTIDKTSKLPTFNGEFSVNGGADEAQNFDISEFVECVGPLIKNIDNTDS